MIAGAEQAGNAKPGEAAAGARKGNGANPPGQNEAKPDLKEFLSHFIREDVPNIRPLVYGQGKKFPPDSKENGLSREDFRVTSVEEWIQHLMRSVNQHIRGQGNIGFDAPDLSAKLIPLTLDLDSIPAMHVANQRVEEDMPIVTSGSGFEHWHFLVTQQTLQRVFISKRFNIDGCHKLDPTINLEILGGQQHRVLPYSKISSWKKCPVSALYVTGADGHYKIRKSCELPIDPPSALALIEELIATEWPADPQQHWAKGEDLADEGSGLHALARSYTMRQARRGMRDFEKLKKSAEEFLNMTRDNGVEKLQARHRDALNALCDSAIEKASKNDNLGPDPYATGATTGSADSGARGKPDPRLGKMRYLAHCFHQAGGLTAKGATAVLTNWAAHQRDAADDGSLPPLNADEVQMLVIEQYQRAAEAERELRQLNEEHVYVAQQALVWNFRHRKFFSPSQFMSNHNDLTIWHRYKGKVAQQELGWAWLHWEERHKVQCVDYTPGRKGVWLNPNTDEYQLSVWPGLGVRPVRNDKLARYGAKDPGWLYKFLAYRSAPQTPEQQEYELAFRIGPIRFAGQKNHAFFMMRSDEREVGKTLELDIMAGIYGDTAIVIDEKALKDNHNTEFGQASLAIWDEAEDADGPSLGAMKNNIKRLVTAKKNRINPKGKDSFKVTNYLNFMGATNEPKLEQIEIGDMKFYVSGCPSIKMDKTEWQPLYDAVKNLSVMEAAVYDWLNNPLIYPRAEDDPELSEAEMNEMRENEPDKFYALQDKMLERMNEPWPDPTAEWDETKGPKPLLWNHVPESRGPDTAEKQETIELGLKNIDAWLIALASDFENIATPLYRDTKHYDRASRVLLVCSKEIQLLYRLAHPSNPYTPSVDTITRKMKTIISGRRVRLKIGAERGRRANTYFNLMLRPDKQAPQVAPDEADEDGETPELVEWQTQRGICNFIAAANAGMGEINDAFTQASGKNLTLRQGWNALTPAERKLGPHKDDLKHWCDIPDDLLEEMEAMANARSSVKN